MTHDEILTMLGDYVDYLIDHSSAEAPMWNIEKVRSGQPNKWNYIDGCMITATLSLYKTTGQEKYLRFSKDFIDYFVQPDGSIKTFDPDTDISYGRTFHTRERTRIGVLPIGYADGFFRGLSNRMSVVTDQGPAPQRGRICMDMCMVDLTDLPDVKVGDTVEIFGSRQKVDDLAALLDTIPYELTCAVSRRVPRVYLEDGEIVERSLHLL